MLYLILAVFRHLITVNADLGNAYCPCQIHIDKDGYRDANCLDQNLTTIPNCIPNNTQVLGFDFNDLRYRSGQFQRFENLSLLSMYANEKFVAHTDSFQFLSSLSALDLSFTNYSSLSGEIFLYQSNLRFLGLRGILNLNVTQALFDHLGNLETLILNDKANLELQNGSFVGLPLLRELDITTIDDLLLHKYSFFGLSALKNLNIQNPLATINLPEEVFKPLTSVEELHLEGLCSVLFPSFDCKSIDERLQHAPSIQRLYIDKTLISHLGKGFLALKNLKELYFCDSIIEQCCGIFAIQSETFKNLSDSPLTKLVFGQCKMNMISRGWFKYLTELKEIYLFVTSFSYYSFWESFTFDLKTTSINKVRLSLTTHDGHFPNHFTVNDGFNETQLTFLELTDTKFNSVNNDIITKLPKSLIYLNLTFNYINYFGVEKLNYLDNLKTLDLSNQFDFQEQSSSEKGYGAQEYNPKIELKKQEFSYPIRNPLEDKNQKRFNVAKTKCLSLPHRLETLSKSSLLCNMVHAFCGSNNSLKILKASLQRDRSCFETLSFWSVLKNLANLEKLNLNRNLITEIPHGAFSELYKLRTLLLNNNKLLTLSFNVNDLISLETLDFSANSIGYASNSFTSQIEDISRKTHLTVHLGINPLICNCKHLDFVAWLTVTQVISNKSKLNCAFEHGTRLSIGKLSHVHNLKYKCTMHDVIIGCIVIFWGLNFILAGLAYIWHNRQKLKYLVSFGRRTLNPYHPIEDHDIEMEYDVYISYEGDYHVTRDMTLRDFVIYKILPRLEQRGVSVMIREDIDAGRNLYEEITQTVRRSKKVLAFMTNGYCSDMWNVFEFNQAVMEGIYTNRQVAIPILFESLRRENVKEEICEFLRMEPVHKHSPELSDRAFIDFLYDRIRDTRQFG